MKNAKIKKLEPKEWLDKMVNELDRLHSVDSMSPDGVESYFDTGLEYGLATVFVTVPSLPILAKATGYEIKNEIRSSRSGYSVYHYFYYHGHKIYSVDFDKTFEEAQALCN